MILQKVKMRQQILDAKLNSHASGEADECLFEYLHTEMINYTLSKTSEKKVITLDLFRDFFF